ncbi:hypothetical protein ACFQ4X_07030 [Fictibacillus halophilus]|uniref:hypothetical protein n=1 Tax=Fictibacillus halophilus TaxID=1610490 RepID=UPI0036413DAD
MYFITTFTKLEKSDLGWRELGSQRTIGYFTSLEDARDIVIHNQGDICETVYHYALIEKIEEGLYPHFPDVELYRVKDITKNVDEKEVYNMEGLTYERIELPEDFGRSCLAIG